MIKIFVVEADLKLFTQMGKCLQGHAIGRDVNIEVIYAHNLMSARQKVAPYRIAVVSTDMTYPVSGEEQNQEAGAIFVDFIQKRIRPSPTVIIYSNESQEEIGRKLEKHGVKKDTAQKKKSLYPSIIKKEASHDTWARAVLDAVMAR